MRCIAERCDLDCAKNSNYCVSHGRVRANDAPKVTKTGGGGAGSRMRTRTSAYKGPAR